MKQSICFFLFASCIFLSFSSCKKDNSITEVPFEERAMFYANVPQSLWIYFRRFEDEAFERGLEIDLNAENISAEIMEISETNVAGTCSYGSHQPGHVTIDESFWNQASDLFKEFIIFHELGHCSLHRGHREDANPDGTCVSLMRSGLEDCRDNYRATTREVYLDELFEFIE